jgi:hypothetical protein
MATTKAPTTNPKRRQYIILGVGAGLLALLAVIQLPKVLGGGSSSTPEAVAQAPAATTPGTATTAPATTVGVTPGQVVPTAVASAAPGGAFLAGASLPPLPVAPVDEGQLGSFNLLRPKDPFVQLVSTTGVSVQATGAYGSVSAQIEAERARQRAAAARRRAAQTNVAGATGTRRFATIAVNDKVAQTKLKSRFPASKQFLLRSLAPTTATVTVMSGSLPKGLTVQLKLGKTTTLLNSKTGQRTTLRLLYTGAEPEQITTVKTGK